MLNTQNSKEFQRRAGGEFALKKTYDAARKTAKYDSAALRDTSRIMYAKKAIPKDPLGFG